MRHCSDGRLRLLVDEPSLASPAERAHVAGCPACRLRLDRLAARAERLGVLLGAAGAGAPRVDVERGLERLRRRAAAGRGPGSSRPAGPAGLAGALGTRRRRLSVAVAAALAAVLVTTVASGWAQSLVVVFRQPGHVVVVPVGPREAAGLQALANYGTLSYSRLPLDHRVASAAAAEAEAGYAPLRPGPLPGGVADAPTYFVQPALTVAFTFDATRARAAAARHGGRPPPMPADVDGATIAVDVGAEVYAEYGARDAGPYSLTTLRMRAPTVRTTGVSLERLQEYLLTLPDVSPELAARLRAAGDEAGTLPLLVLSADGAVQPARVQDAPASMLTGSSRYGSGFAWIRDGFVVAVYGSSPTPELRAAAEGAR